MKHDAASTGVFLFDRKIRVQFFLVFFQILWGRLIGGEEGEFSQSLKNL